MDYQGSEYLRHTLSNCTHLVQLGHSFLGLCDFLNLATHVSFGSGEGEEWSDNALQHHDLDCSIHFKMLDINAALSSFKEYSHFELSLNTPGMFY